ncbi:MAG: hypothetical protein RLY63_324 [Chloroflexota bacterium]|jgi:hypothetical protein
MFFYEIYEAEDELALGVTLAHDERIPPEDFLAVVEEARGRIIESYTEETLVEAIALELERNHGFYPALDHRLVAAVRASSEEGETALIPLNVESDDAAGALVDEERDPDLKDAEDLLAGREPRAMRSAVVELERSEDEPN